MIAVLVTALLPLVVWAWSGRDQVRTERAGDVLYKVRIDPGSGDACVEQPPKAYSDVARRHRC